MLLIVAIQGFLMMLLPVAALLLVRRRWPLAWGWIGVGALMFFAAQVPKSLTGLGALQLPQWVSALPTEGWTRSWLFIIISAAIPGVWEELAKWLPQRIVRPVNWAAVLSFGLGFGGFESVLLGINTAATALIAGVAPEMLSAMLPAEAVATITGPVQPLLLFTALLAVVERAMAMALHAALAVLTARAVLLRRIRLLFLAMLLHTLVDLLPAYYQLVSPTTATLLVTEACVVVMGVLSFVYVRRAVTGPWPLADTDAGEAVGASAGADVGAGAGGDAGGDAGAAMGAGAGADTGGDAGVDAGVDV